ncbi:hypothetical protein HQ865_09855 [Mucilaginibacter mali]|uniref:Fungal lipase-type domain-containing protein n=1 Tax=Mucilaginibacter mali TaxID=2740462 RepID=A0A7D4PTJ7_9SPHI|nr:hypothetical protein [Mucilaginibacter mali]QKJ30048.1 hypothetical protein HQ865_09855 [Mucilaginibacter mali]
MQKQLRLILIFLLLTVTGFAQQRYVGPLAPTGFHPDMNRYEQETAMYMAYLSDLSYEDGWSVKDVFDLVDRTYPSAKLACRFLQDRKSGTQAIVWGMHEGVIVAIRGTQPKQLLDWLTDLKISNYVNTDQMDERLKALPAGHAGFRKAAMRLVEECQLLDAISEVAAVTHPGVLHAQVPVYLTGHSMGAGISQLLIPVIAGHFRFAGAYHFAPPLAVAIDQSQGLKERFGNKVYDIVNYKDYVTRAGRNETSHYGKFYRICKEGELDKENEVFARFKGLEYLTEFSLHSLESYIKLLRQPKNTTGLVQQRMVNGQVCKID